MALTVQRSSAYSTAGAEGILSRIRAKVSFAPSEEPACPQNSSVINIGRPTKFLPLAALTAIFSLFAKSPINNAEVGNQLPPPQRDPISLIARADYTDDVVPPPALPKPDEFKDTGINKPHFSHKTIDNGETSILTFNTDHYQTRIIKAWDTNNRAEKVSSMVNRYNAKAGINGGFFDLSTRSMIGIEIIDGEIASWNSGEHWYQPILYIDKNDKPHVYHSEDPLHLYFLIDGKKYPIHGANFWRGKNRTIIYNKYYYKNTTGSNPSGMDVVVENGRITKITNGFTPIPKDGYVISFGRNTVGSLRKTLSEIEKHTAALAYNLPEGIRDALTLGSTLVENKVLMPRHGQEKVGSYVKQRHVRTGIGITGNEITFITSKRSRTLEEFAWLFQKFGIPNAYNCDGGGSTSIAYKKDDGTNFARNGRGVVNSIIEIPKEKKLYVAQGKLPTVIH